MNYHYKGKQYRLELNHAGKIEHSDRGIQGDTTAEVEAAIRKHVDGEKAMKPTAVLTFGDRHGGDRRAIYEAKAKALNVGGPRYPQVWMTWKEGKYARRAKFSISSVYLDTPENRATMEKIIDLTARATRLEAERDVLLGTLETLSLKGD